MSAASELPVTILNSAPQDRFAGELPTTGHSAGSFRRRDASRQAAKAASDGRFAESAAQRIARPDHPSTVWKRPPAIFALFVFFVAIPCGCRLTAAKKLSLVFS